MLHAWPLIRLHAIHVRLPWQKQRNLLRNRISVNAIHNFWEKKKIVPWKSLWTPCIYRCPLFYGFLTGCRRVMITCIARYRQRMSTSFPEMIVYNQTLRPNFTEFRLCPWALINEHQVHNCDFHIEYFSAFRWKFTIFRGNNEKCIYFPLLPKKYVIQTFAVVLQDRVLVATIIIRWLVTLITTARNGGNRTTR